MSADDWDLLVAYANASRGAAKNDPNPGEDVTSLVEAARLFRADGGTPATPAIERAMVAAWLIEEGLRLDLLGDLRSDADLVQRGLALLGAAQRVLVGDHVHSKPLLPVMCE